MAMAGFNHFTFSGTIVDGVELKQTQSGFQFMELIVSVGERFFDKDNNKWSIKEVDFPITFFGDSAVEISQTAALGQVVIVSGKVKSESAKSGSGNDYYKIRLNGTSCEVVNNPNTIRANQNCQNTGQNDNMNGQSFNSNIQNQNGYNQRGQGQNNYQRQGRQNNQQYKQNYSSGTDSGYPEVASGEDVPF